MSTKIRKNKSKLALLALYAIFITLIILISTVYIAENEYRGKIDFDKYHYRLTFPNDGKLEHYDVVRTDPSKHGLIDLKYSKLTNTLEVETINIKELEIDCRSIAVEKNEEILGDNYYDNSNAYKQYFIDKKIFKVMVDADHQIEITYVDVPYPYQVIVNDIPITEIIEYTYSDGEISTTVPKGHSDVVIYFVSNVANAPKARFIVQYEYLVPGAAMVFNASISNDDGYIKDYLWDFGDGEFDSGEIVTHRFDGPGRYGVILTVRDDDDLIDSFSRMIFVKDDNNNNLPDDWEIIYDVSDPVADDDEDMLTNINEYKYGTDPKNPDTDDDGFLDGNEVELGTDPMDASNYPQDKKKSDTQVLSSWTIFAIVGVSIFFAILFGYYFSHVLKIRKLKLEKEEMKTLGKSGLPKKRRKIAPQQADMRKSMGYAASTIPKEIISHGKEPLPFRPPSRKPPGPRLKDLKTDSDNLHGKMVDEDLKVPLMYKVIYECPTCESPIKEDDEICQTCGQYLED